MNIVIYCRVSSRDQVDGTSLDSQETACREYADKHGLIVSRVFVEEGESAKFADRTELLALLDYCRDKKHRVETLVVSKIDRFARNVEDHFTLKAALRKLGVNIISVTEPIQSDPNGKLLETILAGFAQFDNDIRAIRCVQGMQQRLREGIFPWKPPLGYLPPKNGKKVNPDYPDPQFFEPVRRAWQLFASGGYTRADILNLLRSWGVTGYRGGLLNAQVLDDTFHNPFYVGIVRDPWTGIEYPGRHVPMVSREEFAAVQLAIAKRTHARPYRRVHSAFPLRALVRCPSCSRYMSSCFARGKRQRYAYYLCFRKDCPTRTKSYPAGRVHREFEDFLREVSVPEHLSGPLLAEMVSMLNAEVDAETAGGQSRNRSIQRLERQLQEAISLRSMQAISHEEFLAQRKRIDLALHELRGAGQGRRQTLTTAEVGDLRGILADLNAAWGLIPPEHRRVFGELLLPAGYVYERIRTADRGLLFRTCGTSEPPKSDVVDLTKTNLNTLISEIHRFLAVCRTNQRDPQSHSEAA